MTVQLTEAGKRAYQILDWVYEDPDARSADGLAQVNQLAKDTSDEQALAQISGAGTILARLSDSLTAPSP